MRHEIDFWGSYGSSPEQHSMTWPGQQMRRRQPQKCQCHQCSSCAPAQLGHKQLRLVCTAQRRAHRAQNLIVWPILKRNGGYDTNFAAQFLKDRRCPQRAFTCACTRCSATGQQELIALQKAAHAPKVDFSVTCGCMLSVSGV